MTNSLPPSGSELSMDSASLSRANVSLSCVGESRISLLIHCRSISGTRMREVLFECSLPWRPFNKRQKKKETAVSSLLLLFFLLLTTRLRSNRDCPPVVSIPPPPPVAATVLLSVCWPLRSAPFSLRFTTFTPRSPPNGACFTALRGRSATIQHYWLSLTQVSHRGGGAHGDGGVGAG